MMAAPIKSSANAAFFASPSRGLIAMEAVTPIRIRNGAVRPSGTYLMRPTPHRPEERGIEKRQQHCEKVGNSTYRAQLAEGDGYQGIGDEDPKDEVEEPERSRRFTPCNAPRRASLFPTPDHELAKQLQGP